MRKNVSLKDIANSVGVSVALVSYVLNGHAKKKRVGDAVAKRVEETARKLNYHPNQIAKSLKTRKSDTIGLIVGNIYYRYTTGVTQAIEAEAKKKGVNVIIGNTHESLTTFKELVHVLIHRQVDGLIIVAVENSEREIRQLLKREIPFVLIDRSFPRIKTNFIGINNYKVAYAATEYLVGRGFRRILFINYKTTSFHLLERTRGYRAALGDQKIDVAAELQPEIRKTHPEEDVREVIRQLVSSAACDAIFFATGNLAIAGLKIILELGIKIPRDVSVLSFDESEAFALFSCPVTHFRQPLEEIGKAAVRLLFEDIEEDKGIRQLYLDSLFVPGKSCGE
ncbi:MAG: LacI family DNA-binding transcriptional regulator [Williamsia sp.]|nr:LacI family DNA-binding transcriptional regulator [Williamsia sp.]